MLLLMTNSVKPLQADKSTEGNSSSSVMLDEFWQSPSIWWS